MESSIFTFKAKKFISRGFLNGPLCPVYGTGMIFIIITLTPLKNYPVLLFLMGGLVASLIEYITGFLLEYFFKTKWWDYTNDKWNIKGYVCALNSFYWCVLATVMMYFIQPSISKLVNLIDVRYVNIVASLILVFLLFDTIVTILALIDLRSTYSKLNDLRHQLSDYIEYETKLGKVSLTNSFEVNRQQLLDSLDNLDDVDGYKKRVIKKMNELNKEFQKNINSFSFIQRRFFSAYPKLKSHNFKESFNEIKSRFNRKND